MGRTNFNSVVSRAYAIMPVAQVIQNVTGTTDYVQATSSPAPILGIVNAETGAHPSGPLRDIGASNSSRPSAPLGALPATKQGFMWSLAAASGAAGAQTLALRNAATSLMTAPVDIPTGAQTHISGVVEGSWRAVGDGGAAALGADNRLNTAATRGTNLFVDATDASQVVTRPALGVILTPSIFADNVGATTPTDRLFSFFPGAVKGFYITVPMGDNDLASGATNGDVRYITMPITIKLHEVCFSTGASAAGNSLKLRNITTAADITGSVAMVSATADAAVVAVGSLVAAQRTLHKGDVIAIQGSTGGTGITSAAAMLTGHTLGHFHVTSPHLDTITAVPTTVEPSALFRNQSSAWVGRTNFSGPCRGGMAFLQLPARNGQAGLAVPTNQVNFGASRVIAPFDCYLAGWGFTYRASAASNTLSIVNITKAVDHVADTAAVSTAATSSPSFIMSTLLNPTISKGDVIELRADTAATSGFAALGGFLLVHVRGHVNANPALD